MADASHELKTPLTVIMTNAELLNSPDFDQAHRSQFAAHILTMSRQMRQLIEEMLDLARTDNGQGTLVFSPVDLSRLVNDAVLPFEPVFFERGLTLTADIQEHITVSGSQQHLRQITDILLDNAQKYSSSAGEVTVQLTRQGGAAGCRYPIPAMCFQKQNGKTFSSAFIGRMKPTANGAATDWDSPSPPILPLCTAGKSGWKAAMVGTSSIWNCQ